MVSYLPRSQILTIHFVILSFDRYSRDDVVGEVGHSLIHLIKHYGPFFTRALYT
jgi:hypothetical protein